MYMPSIRMGDWVPTGNAQNAIWKKSLCGTIRDACRERAYAAVFAWKNAGSHGNRVREKQKMTNFFRFLRDVPYDLLVPPEGCNYRAMTPAQAKRSFAWFLEHIPERMQYMRARCAKDLKISEERLDYSSESLVFVWRWFIKTARIEKTPQEEVEQMEKAAVIFGESYVNRTQFTVATQYILRDVAMYLGQCYVKNYKVLTWSYRTKPKSDVYLNQPLVSGFQSVYEGKCKPLSFPPLHMARVQAAKIFKSTQSSYDLHDIFEYWCQYIPDAEQEAPCREQK